MLFGEKGGKLYVKVLGKQSAEECVLKALQDGPLELSEIAAVLAKAYPNAAGVELMKTLADSGKVALRTVAGTSQKKWFFVAY